MHSRGTIQLGKPYLPRRLRQVPHIPPLSGTSRLSLEEPAYRRRKPKRPRAEGSPGPPPSTCCCDASDSKAWGLWLLAFSCGRRPNDRIVFLSLKGMDGASLFGRRHSGGTHERRNPWGQDGGEGKPPPQKARPSLEAANDLFYACLCDRSLPATESPHKGVIA